MHGAYSYCDDWQWDPLHNHHNAFPSEMYGPRLPAPADVDESVDSAWVEPGPLAHREASLSEIPLCLIRDASAWPHYWQPLMFDEVRRCFSFKLQNPTTPDVLEKEFHLLRSKAQWTELRTREDDSTTRLTACESSQGRYPLG
mmetsp:Transcript_46679/g.114474  ORF Transcript_46679/g.114474 Transcript_46679/m.114474 type:complete len:143 (-) Transcript_46679:608-1036(-)